LAEMPIVTIAATVLPLLPHFDVVSFYFLYYFSALVLSTELLVLTF
jgi:hypothetical protein